MKRDPLVSVIITCYNLGNFLPEAIDSIIKQTYKNIEILVIDDGSTDNTKEVSVGYKSVRYYRQNNKGVCMARNKGLDLAKGEYIAFLDADDTFNKQYVELCLKKLLSLKSVAKVGYVFTQVRHFGVENYTTNYPEYNIEILTKRGPYINVSALMQKELISSVRFNPKVSGGYEDWDFYLSLYEKGVEGRLLNQPLLNYRRTGSKNSISSNTEGTYKLFITKRKIMKLHPKLFNKYDISKFYINYWLGVITIKAKKILKKVLPT